MTAPIGSSIIQTPVTRLPRVNRHKQPATWWIIASTFDDGNVGYWGMTPYRGRALTSQRRAALRYPSNEDALRAAFNISANTTDLRNGFSLQEIGASLPVLSASTGAVERP